MLATSSQLGHPEVQPGYGAAVRVLVADSCALVRAGLRALLEAEPDLRVVGEADDADNAARLAATVEPHVAVAETAGPPDGFLTVARLRETCRRVRILGLTDRADGPSVRRALEAGASGCVSLRSDTADLVHAVRVVAGGGSYVDPLLAGELVDSFLGRDRPPGLSGREERVLRLIAVGYVNKEVAAQLGVSVKTVETYKLRAMEKLGLTSRVDVVRHASRRGWLDDIPAGDPVVRATSNPRRGRREERPACCGS